MKALLPYDRNREWDRTEEAMPAYETGAVGQ